MSVFNTSDTELVIPGTVSHIEAENLIATLGTLVTYLLVGDMGWGKTSILKALAKRFPNHVVCYFDCTTKVDGGDMMLPNIKAVEFDENGGMSYVQYAPNEELGLHHGKPVIMMLDEIGKNRALLPALTRLMQERSVGTIDLHPESIVFGTTNKSTENVGDFFDAHQHNRVSEIVLRKPTPREWLGWALDNNIHRSVMGFVQDFPAVFQRYEDVESPNDNPYIMHPDDPARTKFVTGRSLEKASHILHKYDEHRDLISDNAMQASLMGTIGPRAAKDMAAFVALSGKMPTLAQIKADPLEAPLPEDNITAICMVVFNALSAVEREWVNEWLDYMLRLPLEAQSMFVNGVMAKEYPEKRREMFFKNKKYLKWITDNKHLYTAQA